MTWAIYRSGLDISGMEYSKWLQVGMVMPSKWGSYTSSMMCYYCQWICTGRTKSCSYRLSWIYNPNSVVLMILQGPETTITLGNVREA